MNRAIFIDKDGTLIRNIHYSADPELIRFTDAAIPGLKKLARAGYELYVITNQQGVALGYFTEADVLAVKKRLEEMFAMNGLRLSGFYYCPHHADDVCSCRKPEPGMIETAAAAHALDLSRSWMIGDIPTDIAAGKAAGCRTLLFDKGYENDWEFADGEAPDGRVSSLNEAADIILTTEVRPNYQDTYDVMRV